MRQRRHPNIVAVALANKNARIAWSLLTRDGVYDARLSVGAALKANSYAKGPHLQLQSNGGRWRNGSPPSLPEPGVWTGMASANALAPLRWKRAKIHRGSRRRSIKPRNEAGYTSAVVTLNHSSLKIDCIRAGSIYVQTGPESVP
jgi:hypothetical protein